MTFPADVVSAPSTPWQSLLRHPLMAPVVITLLAVLVISAPNLIDPMIRFDDYPALFAEPSGYWEKTKDEGRWLNYWWHLRGVTTPAWLNFAVYQISWALFAVLLAIGALRNTPNRIWFTTVLALFVLVSPSATLISLWFNTLLPGLGLVALYAGLGLLLPARAHRILLVPFTVLTFMSYTTYPLLLLAVAITNSADRSIRDIIALLALFTASFALAVMCVYSLNLFVHGIFGVAVAEWRNATPATDWSSFLGNLPLVAQSFRDFAYRSSFDFAPAIYFHLGFLAVSTFVLFRRAPVEAIYLHAGLLTGLALIVVQVLKVGVITPPRAFLFSWVFYAIITTRAAQLLTADGGLAGRLARNAVLLIVCSYMLQTFLQYMAYRGWQADTRALAHVVRTIDGPIAIADDIRELPSAQAAFIQDTRALSFRLRQLTGKSIPVCVEEQTSYCLQSPAAENSCPTLLRVDMQKGSPRIVFE